MSDKYLSKLQSKRVLVVGGTSGIGFAVAEACVAHGAYVVVASSKIAKVERAVERIQESCPTCADNVRGHACNLLDQDVESELLKLFEFATNGGKDKLDHVVNTAGDISGMVSLADSTPEKIMNLARARIVPAVIMAKVATQYLHSSYTSTLTITGGVNSSKPSPGWSVLSAIGSSVEGLARGLAVDMKPIRVNCVSPGAVRTELLEGFAGGDEKKLQGMLELYGGKSLVNRVGLPEDLAECYLGLMRNHFVTRTNGAC